jgi:hypothetical protein|tara:strand:+ start:3038 stop:3355 length:318 start_codon:yes stop_codon:yes gene_type:complete
MEKSTSTPKATKQIFNVTVSAPPKDGDAQFEEIGKYQSLASAVINAVNHVQNHMPSGVGQAYIGLSEQEYDSETGEYVTVGYYGSTIMDYNKEYGWSFYSPPSDR